MKFNKSASVCMYARGERQGAVSQRPLVSFPTLYNHICTTESTAIVRPSVLPSLVCALPPPPTVLTNETNDSISTPIRPSVVYVGMHILPSSPPSPPNHLVSASMAAGSSR